MTSLKNSVATGVIAGAMALTALPAVAAEKWDMPMAYSGSRSEEHTSELQSLTNLVCRLLLEKKKQKTKTTKIGRAHA